MRLIIAKILFTVALISYPFVDISSSQDKSVYICKGKYSKKYHYSKSCRGLSNCKSSISKVSLSEAKKIGRTLCGWED